MLQDFNGLIKRKTEPIVDCFRRNLHSGMHGEKMREEDTTKLLAETVNSSGNPLKRLKDFVRKKFSLGQV